MLRFILAIAFLQLSVGVHALETDNYITWDKELKDSSDAINGYVKDSIETALDKVNNRRKVQDCEDVTLAVAKRFRTLPPSRHPLEDWLHDNLPEDHIFPKEHDYRKQSIYTDYFRFYLKFVPLAPNVNVNGVYLGTDKLSHFVSTGRRYFKRYLKRINKGDDELEALKSAIKVGLSNESSFLGMWTSGVFSYADMEANYQGLLFYKKMCMDGENSYLSQNEEGTWTLKTPPDIRDYVSAYWDESFNLSYRHPKNWKKTSRVIKEKYCKAEIPLRFQSYLNFVPNSFSLEYIKELQAEHSKVTPIPQSVDELCQQE